jgi:hypothetical protein
VFDVEEISSLIGKHKKFSIESVFLVMKIKVIEQSIKNILPYDEGKLKFLEERRKALLKILKKSDKRIKDKRKEIEKLEKNTNVKIKSVPIFDVLSSDLKVNNDIPKVVKDQYYVYRIVKEEFA